jgi:hypothetical protein
MYVTTRVMYMYILDIYASEKERKKGKNTGRQWEGGSAS